MNILKCEFISEAVQISKILLFLLLMPAIIFSQDLSNLKQDVSIKALSEMTDTELGAYWLQAQERGYNLDQIKTLARAQGVSESDLIEFEKRVKTLGDINQKTEEDKLMKTQNELTTIFGLETEEAFEEK